jgi:hypothetical protein
MRELLVRQLKIVVVMPLLALGFGAVIVSAQTIGGVPLTATLTFTDPTGTAWPMASIPVQMKLSLASGSAALTTDASGSILGLTPADITPYLYSGRPAGEDASNAAHAYLGEAYGCGTQFSFGTSSCGGTPYGFTFNLNPPTLADPANFALTAGTSVGFLLGTFTPSGGTAPAGTYILPDADVQINVYDGNWNSLAFILVADTQNEFTRTVAAACSTAPSTLPPGDLFCSCGVNGPGNIYDLTISYCASGAVVPTGDLFCSAGANGPGHIYDPTISSCANGAVVPIGSSLCPAGAYGPGGIYIPSTGEGCYNGVVLPIGDLFCLPGANGPGGLYNPSKGDSCTDGVVLPFGTLPPVVPPSKVATTASGLTYSRVSKTFNGTVTIKNIGSSAISGPFEILFAGLPANVTLVNEAGTLSGSPYVTVPAVTSLAPAQSVTVSVQFENPSNATVSFTPVIYSGSVN